MALVTNLFLHAFSGLLLGIVTGPIPDAFTLVMIPATFVFAMEASFVLLEFPTLVTGPEDYSFYACRPVNGATYFAGKLLATATVTMGFSLVFLLSHVTLRLIAGGSITAVAAACYAVLISAVIATFAVVNLYGLLVRLLPLRAIRGIATVVQMLVMFAVYGSYAFLPHILQGPTVGLRLTPALLLLPSVWGGSVIRLGTGDPVALTGFVLSLLLPAILLLTGARVVSVGYGRKMAEGIHPDRPRKRRPPRRTLGGLLMGSRPEGRIMTTLISRSMRYDATFRTTILAIVPLTALYIVIVVFSYRAPLADPFSAAGRAGFAKTFLLYIAIAFAPFYIKNALTHSAEAAAAWMLFATPVNRLRLLLASRRFILLFFVGPYMLVLYGVYAAASGSPLNVLRHFAVIFLLVYLETSVLLLVFPEMPFSRTAQWGEKGGGVVLRLLVALAALTPLFLLVQFAYPSPVRYWLSLLCIATAAAGTEVLGRRRAAKRLARAEFTAR